MRVCGDSTLTNISTLIPDIYEYVSGKKPEVLSEDARNAAQAEFMEACGDIVDRFLKERQAPQEFRIRPSILGTPDRKLWFMAKTEGMDKGGVSQSSKAATYRPITFLFGSLTEALVLLLVKLAGHEVKDFQKEVTLGGVTGSLDARIDGVLTDVKSASPYSFTKFKTGEFLMPNPEVDPFGYKDQISFYVNADGEARNENEQREWAEGRVSSGASNASGSFLVMDKSSGELTMCLVDSDTGLKTKGEVEKRIEHVKKVIEKDTPPAELCYEPIPFGKGGNMEINRLCAMCPFKVKGGCFPNLRAFKYANGVKYLSHVVKEPDVPEVLLDD